MDKGITKTTLKQASRQANSIHPPAALVARFPSVQSDTPKWGRRQKSQRNRPQRKPFLWGLTKLWVTVELQTAALLAASLAEVILLIWVIWVMVVVVVDVGIILGIIIIVIVGVLIANKGQKPFLCLHSDQPGTAPLKQDETTCLLI